jgi:xanthine dehydrogenase accessory factor
LILNFEDCRSDMFFVLVRGGGDLASGVALSLHQSGLPIIITELPMPLAVRRRVCFASAVYAGSVRVEDCPACRVDDPIDITLIEEMAAEGTIPVLIDPVGFSIGLLRPKVVIDGRMLKRHSTRPPKSVELLIGLGPGFIAGENCDAVVETNRGVSMGRVIWEGAAEPNTSNPEAFEGHQEARVLRAPADGVVETVADIGDRVIAGQTIAQVGSHLVCAAFDGILRGLLYPGLRVKRGMRIGDLDPRDDPSLCNRISEKSLAVAGGVLDAIRSKFDLSKLKG